MSEIANPLLFALLFVVIGFIGGALVLVAWHSLSANSQKEKAPEESNPNLIELLQIYRSKSTRQLILKLNNRQIDSQNELKPVEREFLRKVYAEILSWLNLTQENVSPLPGSQELNTQPVSQPAERHMKTHNEEPSPIEMLKLPLRPKKTEGTEVKPDPRSMSIVAQIDIILQDMLETSEFKTRAIKLDESPMHEVIVWVGVSRYEGIDSIPDPEIKAFIQQAVARWEQQNSETP